MPTIGNKPVPFCNRCYDAKVVKNASYKCLQCREKLCPTCAQNHLILRPCLANRVMDMRTGKLVDTVFNIEMEVDETDGVSKTMLAKRNPDHNSLKSPFQVVRTFGKPIYQLTMRKSNKIAIPLTLWSQGTQRKPLNVGYKEDNIWRRAETFHSTDAKKEFGEFNENGDFFASTSTSKEKKPKQSILKRTSSFQSESADGIWSIEIPVSSSSGSLKKEVRFSSDMDQIKEESKGILREYSSNFYHMLDTKNTKKMIKDKVSYFQQQKKKPRSNSLLNPNMVSQSSIVIGQQEIAGKISGVMFLNDIYLVVIDRVNNKMKIFDSRDRFKIVIDKKIPKGAWGVTSPEDNIIAMTCRSKVVFYGLFEILTPRYEKQADPQIKPLNVEYRLRASCYGISFCESRDLFFVSCNVFFSDPSIFIVDTKGYTQRIIRTVDDDISSSIPFSETLLVDSDRGVIYIGDRIGKRIICTNYEGKLIWVVSLPGTPVSMTLVGDKIYTCTDSRKISLVHRDGRFVKDLFLLDLDCRRICHHSPTNHLVALTKAFWGVSHFIQVYQL